MGKKNEDPALQKNELPLQSEDKFRAIFEGANDGILVAGIKTKKFILANPRICEITGYPLKELLNLSVNDIHPKKDLSYVNGQFAKQVQGKLAVAKDIPVLRKDRKVIYCDVNSKLVKIGGQQYLVGFFRDITERKKAEEALKISDGKHRTLIENLPQKIFFKDKNSVYISCNQNYARDLKIKADEISGKTDYDFYPKELAEKYRADDKRIMESGKIEDIEERYVQNGQEFIVHTVKTPIKDEEGNAAGIVGIFWDITERKKAEEELRESEKYMSTILDAMQNGIVIINAETHKIIEVNPAAAKMIGAPANKIEGSVCHNYICPAEKGKCPITDLGQKVDNSERLLLIANNQKIPIIKTVTPIMLKGRKHLLESFVDITERKKAEEELKKVNQELKSKVDELERFNKLAVGRELKMIELKKRIKELEEKNMKGGMKNVK